MTSVKHNTQTSNQQPPKMLSLHECECEHKDVYMCNKHSHGDNILTKLSFGAKFKINMADNA